MIISVFVIFIQFSVLFTCVWNSDEEIRMKFTKFRTRLIDCGRASVGKIRHEKIVFSRRVRETSVERSRSKSHLYYTSHLAHEYENRGRFSRPAKKLSKFYAHRRYLFTEISHVAFHRRGYTSRRREEKIYILFGRIVQCIIKRANTRNITNNVYG